jgi:hypothetical protein
MAIERQIALAFANAIQRNLKLGPDQAYVVAKAHYIPGSPVDKVFQVELANTAIDGAGEGGQFGGALVRKLTWVITGWWNWKMDQMGWSQEAMTRQAEGIMDSMDAIRALFARTSFQMPDDSFLLLEDVRLVSESSTEWYDEELGILYRKITFSTVVAEELPTDPTTLPSDIA